MFHKIILEKGKAGKNSVKKVKSALMILVGVTCVSAAVSLFYIPNKIVSGGVSGISTILYYLFSLPPGATYAVINVILLLLGFKIIGRTFVLKTTICAGLMSVLVQIFSYLPPVTENVLLAAIFGSVLYGFGIGLTLISNASTGGTDILGRLIQHKFPHLPIGKLLLAVDGLVVLASLLLFRTIDLALFGILAVFLSTFAIDILIKKLNVSKLAFVISSKGREISKLLIGVSPRGVTIVDATGAYSNSGKIMLVCALKESELTSFQETVLSYDKDAFLIFADFSAQLITFFNVY